MTVFALLVGIDDYESMPLVGSAEDIDQVREFLTARVSGGVDERALYDGEATRAAIVDGIRSHLGRAGPGDVALFWFSGHGGEEPVPEGLWSAEPSGMMQTLVCADSRTAGPDGTRRPDLLDKELGLLLAEVAARGPHVVVVLDCCHAGGATRDPDVTVRGLGPAPDRLPMRAFLPGLDGWVPPDTSGRQVALLACRLDERAREQRIDGRIRGVFTYALLRALQTLDTTATYRDVLGATQGAVRNLTSGQSPTLEPAGFGPADQPFLGGLISRPAAWRLGRGPSGWEVDAGRCHGLPGLLPGDPIRFAVPSADTAARMLRVVDIAATRSLVEPEGWAPDPQRSYPVVIATLPEPPCAVVVGGLPGDDPDAAGLVRAAVGRAGPGGGLSPDLRVVGADDAVSGLRLRVAAPRIDGRPVLQILRGDGMPATADTPGHTTASAELVVARLEHIARWTCLQQLDNPASALAGLARIEVVPAFDGEQTVPRDRPPLRPDGHGEIRLLYRRVSGQWVPPRVFVRLRNTSARPVWCLLLDLTDLFRSDPGLFGCDPVPPGGLAAALHGGAIAVSLPAGRPAAPGAVVRDWLKLVVAEEPVSPLAFELPALGEPPTRGGPDPTVRAERLRRRDVTGGPASAPGVGGEWATAILPLVTEVPAG